MDILNTPSIGSYVDLCVRHALKLLANSWPGIPPVLKDCSVHLFKQSWPNTACSMPGVAGRAFISGYTVVVVGPTGDAAVYLGRPAYYFDQKKASTEQSEKFDNALMLNHMPSVRDCHQFGCTIIQHLDPMEVNQWWGMGAD